MLLANNPNFNIRCFEVSRQHRRKTHYGKLQAQHHPLLLVSVIHIFNINVKQNTNKQLEKVALVSSAVRLRRDGVTLNFDLLTQKRNQVICVPRCTSDKSLAKIYQ